MKQLIRTVQNADADYDFWLMMTRFDNYVLVPLGSLVLIIAGMVGLWLLCTNRDLLLSLCIALVCGYFMRPLWHRGRRTAQENTHGK